MQRITRYTVRRYLLVFFLLQGSVSIAQPLYRDTSKKIIALSQVVVTATRTEKVIGDVPVPVTIITKKAIQQSGSQRLSDVLQQQAGLILADNPLGQALQGYPNPFGAGVQLQGLDPAYTLILVDGEPLTGRNAGVLNTDRIPIGNIQQIEIVKGPASSLYGSDALAGVINIITEAPKQTGHKLLLYHASNQTWGVTLNHTLRTKKTGIQLFANRYSSGGYDLDKNIYGQTVDPFTQYSFGAKAITQFNSRTQLTNSVRFFNGLQRNNYLTYAAAQPGVVTGNTTETDWSINNQLQNRISQYTKLTARLYATGYNNNGTVYLQKNDSLFDNSFLRQWMVKPEVVIETGRKTNQQFIAGAGFTYETINSSRYAAAQRLTTFYTFVQKEWWIANKFNLTLGTRIDKHNLFALQVNPKIATAYKFNQRWMISAAAGRGFKAPDFRQQFLSFNNSLVGYTLLGNATLFTGLTSLQQQGQIDAAISLSPFSNQAALKAENAVGLNIGVRFTPSANTAVSIDLFRNDIDNLIERYNLPFTKTNGQAIFSYTNINKVFTQGVSVQARQQIGKNWELMGNYQYLQAKDKAIVDKIKRGELYGRDPVSFISTTVRIADYGGLFNRSKHTASFQLAYNYQPAAINANLRAVYRSRLGFSDVNGNAILDDAREYINGYTLLHATVGKQFNRGVGLQMGIDNLLNHTDPARMPGLAGRTFFVNCTINWQQLFINHKKNN